MFRSIGWVFSGILLMGFVGLGTACQQAAPPRHEATSLLGHPLVSPGISTDVRTRLEEDLAQAKAELDRNPGDPEAIIWLGRRTAYLGRYREAIAIYSGGIEKHPGNAKLYRHRGHRYLTVREIEKAVADLEQAADLMTGQPDEIEPDGMPNERDIPRSTTQTNIWYHLGLAYYVGGRFADARQAFSTCMEYSKNDDMIVATGYWLYLTLRQLGLNAEAGKLLDPIHGEMDVIENFAYHELLLLYKGEKSPESLLASTEADAVTSATLLYGLAKWHSMMGASEKASGVLMKILEGEQWAAFGYLAAEAEMARGPVPSKTQKSRIDSWQLKNEARKAKIEKRNSAWALRSSALDLEPPIQLLRLWTLDFRRGACESGRIAAEKVLLPPGP